MEVKEEQTIPAKRIIAEARGKYVCIDDIKVYNFDFPAQSTLIQNYDILVFLKDEVWKAMEDIKKKEEDKKCECKVKEEKAA